MSSPQIIDLKTADEEGNFPCPTCGTVISPDDETEEVYTVLDTTLEDDGSLEQMIIRCNICKNQLTLEGFDMLFEEESSRVGLTEDITKSKPKFMHYFALSFDNQPLGYLQVEYAQKDDVKAFKRLRKLRAGDPFKCTIAFEHKRKDDLQSSDFQLFAKIAKKKFKGLRSRDIFLIEIVDGRKNLIGRASELESSLTTS
ncbi:MAG: hypothetical protein JSV76_00535 [Candidatus Bathyarchaeota archaeon]|nr:MAG: hypothetical protein JSV76_00535 [Candidatus Bathyarchaeota archaeon]